MDTLRALLVTYVFPPTGGVGTERVRKLAKYLPAHGVVPSVLTALNPSVPLIDKSTERDIAPGLEILRARTFEPSYAVKQAAWASSTAKPTAEKKSLVARAKGAVTFVAKQAMIPDPQILWQPDVQRVLATQLFRPHPTTDVVFITAPPFSSFLAAPIARARPGVAVVLDYRDEWQTTRTSYEMIGGKLASTIGSALETSILRLAHTVTTATEAFRENLLERFPFLEPSRVVAITNGYDPDDFPAKMPEPPKDRFVITYAGTVYKLTSPRGFLAGIRRLHEREPELAKHLEVRFIGRIVDTELDAFEGTEALGVKRVGFVDKDRVASELASGHVVLCLQDEIPGNERIYQAKIFELMYLGRPCLTMAPPGALKTLVERHRMGPVIAPRDADGVATWIADQLRAWKRGEYDVKSHAVDVDLYHRRTQAGQFADVFREALSRARR